MKFERKDAVLDMIVVDPNTGEHLETSTITRFHSHYSIKKINFKGCIMKLADAQIQICKSPRDIRIFWILLDNADSENIFRHLNEIAEEADVSYDVLSRVVKRGVETGLFYKLRRGEYQVNPFAFSAKSVSREKLHDLQKNWRGNAN